MADARFHCWLDRYREAILQIAARHGARNVRVFGSVACGKEDEHSDLDLLIDAGPGRSAFFPGGLIAELEELTGRHVDVVTPAALHVAIRAQVVREAVPL